MYVYQGGFDPINLPSEYIYNVENVMTSLHFIFGYTVTGLSKKTVGVYKYFESDVIFLQLPFGTHCVVSYYSRCNTYVQYNYHSFNSTAHR